MFFYALKLYFYFNIIIILLCLILYILPEYIKDKLYIYNIINKCYTSYSSITSYTL